MIETAEQTLTTTEKVIVDDGTFRITFLGHSVRAGHFKIAASIVDPLCIIRKSSWITGTEHLSAAEVSIVRVRIAKATGLIAQPSQVARRCRTWWSVAKVHSTTENS